MKDKKILNICLLTLALVALITFILPIKKIDFNLQTEAWVNVIFYATSIILICALVAIIVFAIINLFKDNYSLVLIMEVMALISIVMVVSNLIIFAAIFNAKICLGYILISIEVFVLANFSQMARLVIKRCDIKHGFNANKHNNSISE